MDFELAMQSELDQLPKFSPNFPIVPKFEPVDDDSPLVLNPELPKETQFDNDPAIVEEHVLAMESQLVNMPEPSEHSPMVQQSESEPVQDTLMVQSVEGPRDSQPNQNLYRPYRGMTAHSFQYFLQQQRRQNNQVPVDPQQTQNSQYAVGSQVVQNTQLPQRPYPLQNTQTAQNLNLSQIPIDPRLIQTAQAIIGSQVAQTPLNQPDHRLTYNVQHGVWPDHSQRPQAPQDLYNPNNTQMIQNFHVSLNPQHIHDCQVPLDPQRAESLQNALGPNRLQDPQLPQDPYRPQDPRLAQSLDASPSPQPTSNSVAPQISQFQQILPHTQVPQHPQHPQASQAPQVAQPAPESQLPENRQTLPWEGPIDFNLCARGFERSFNKLWRSTEEFGIKHANVPNADRDRASAEYTPIVQDLLASEGTRYLVIAKVLNQFIVDVILQPETVKWSDKKLGYELEIFKLECEAGYSASRRYKTLRRISKRLYTVRQGPTFHDFLNGQFRSYWNRLLPILRPFLHDPNDASRDHLIDILCCAIRCAIHIHSFPLEFDINFPAVNAPFDSDEHMNCDPAQTNYVHMRLMGATVRLAITPRMRIKINDGDTVMEGLVSRAKVMLYSTIMDPGLVSPHPLQQLQEMSFGRLD